MFMDQETEAALLFTACWSRFQPVTPMGQEAKRTCRPFLPGQEREWQQTLEEQERLLEAADDQRWADRMEDCLKRVPDIRMILSRLVRGEVPGISEWFQVKRFLWQSRNLSRLLAEKALQSFFPIQREKEWETKLRILNPAPVLTPSFSVDDSFDLRLKRLRKQQAAWEERRRQAAATAAAEVERQTGIRRNRDGEWVVDRRHPMLPHLKERHGLRLMRETPFDAVFALSLPLSEQEAEEQEQLARQIETVEAEVLKRLAESFHPSLSALQEAIRTWCRLDLQWARMRAGRRWHGRRPVYSPDSYELRGGRHPVIEQRLKEKDCPFTPLDLHIFRGVTVIIGPNMGGKTVALRTLGLVAALGQYGFFVPSDEARMPLVPWITAIIGDHQDAESGLSTFGAEVKRLSRVWDRAEPGLLLMDEVGRGTNPREGAALSAAVTARLTAFNHWVVHVTHYGEVLSVRGIYAYRVAGLKQPEGTGEWVAKEVHRWMDYRLLPLQEGESVPRQALTIAAQMGLPVEVVDDARRRLDEQ
ncbi:hypothetical protein GCM10011571_03400 [Marinithermofilum abyssi]|uniref:MutS domain V n=1 Tax=Marinithermofilum abyssi TaxID=1571185 RepID=A0A8J2VD62_9BACL|nr:hypothetical protein [Marinithermofilum abyssi]GGE05622.1 hypothetical protein GCM10011571_03400 [Marinithermofilum abyssi]